MNAHQGVRVQIWSQLRLDCWCFGGVNEKAGSGVDLEGGDIEVVTVA